MGDFRFAERTHRVVRSQRSVFTETVAVCPLTVKVLGPRALGRVLRAVVR
jgi:hypothetical protein